MSYICGDCHEEHKVPKREEDERALTAGRQNAACVFALVRERNALNLQLDAAKSQWTADLKWAMEKNAKLIVAMRVAERALGAAEYGVHCAQASGAEPLQEYLQRVLEDVGHAEKPKCEVSGQGNCSECGALVEHLYSLRCPACYDKLVAGMEKRVGDARNK